MRRPPRLIAIARDCLQQDMSLRSSSGATRAANIGTPQEVAEDFSLPMSAREEIIKKVKKATTSSTRRISLVASDHSHSRHPSMSSFHENSSKNNSENGGGSTKVKSTFAPGRTTKQSFGDFFTPKS